MKVGQKVQFFQKAGDKPVLLTIVEIVGAGASNKKLLNLSEGKKDGLVVSSIEHHTDNPKGPFWLMLGESVPEPKPAVKGGASGKKSAAK